MSGDESRIVDIEMAFMLYMAIAAGEPVDATEEERDAATNEFVAIMDRMRARHFESNNKRASVVLGCI